MLKTITSFVDSLGSLTYKGLWNAATNTPTLASGVGTTGDYYVVSVPGTTTLDGISSWAAGDWAIFNGSVWEKYNNPADTLGEVLANGNTTAGTDISVTTGDDITFANNSKAIFGAGSDLQIYHNGTDSIIEDVGTGNLDIKTNGSYILLRNTDGNNLAYFETGGGSHLYWNGASGLGRKLQTTATGIDVTGSVTADELTVSSDSGGPVYLQDSNATATYNISELSNNAGNFGIQTRDSSGAFVSTDYQIVKNASGADYHRWFTQGTERMRIDASGKVGLNTTPVRVLDIATTTGGTIIHLTDDATGHTATDGVDLQQEGTLFQILNREAGDIRFGTNNTEAMRIDASQNLLVGTNTTTAGNEGMVYFNGSSLRVTRDSDEPLNLDRLGSGGTENGSLIDFKSNGTTVGSIQARGGDLVIGTDDTGIRFNDASNALQPHNATDVTDATIDIGVSSYRFKDLYLSGVAYAGELIVGNTVVPSASSGGAAFDPNTNGRAILKLGTTSTANQGLAEFFNPNGQVGGITTNGSATSYNTSSDQRLKENIAGADDAGSKIDAIQVRKFDWKSDGSHQDYGMVAQELLEVAPEAVSAPQDPEEMMGVDYSKLVPMMLKEIQSLRARVATLEGNPPQETTTTERVII